MRFRFTPVALALIAAGAAHAQVQVPVLSEAESQALLTARMHELRGEDALAFEAYLTFARFDRDAIDVHLRLAGMARGRLGLARARALFRDLSQTQQSPSLRLAAATLSEPGERRRSLESFLEVHPDYGPAHALLASEYAQPSIGTQTLRERLRERELLDRFLTFDAQGRLSASFVDSNVLADWLGRAERRLAVLNAAFGNAIATPTARYMRTNSSWIVHLNLPEVATEVSYRIGNGRVRSTGLSGTVDPRTGRRLVNTHFDVPLNTPATTISVRYRDANGVEAGPFDLAFDPHAILLQRDRDTLAAEQPGWLAFTSGTNSEWVYFNTIVMTRCVIASVEYGFNEPPNRPFPLPPCDMRDPWRMPADARSAVKMTPDVTTVTVRLTFTDGTVETRSYRRPAR